MKENDDINGNKEISFDSSDQFLELILQELLKAWLQLHA